MTDERMSVTGIRDAFVLESAIGVGRSLIGMMAVVGVMEVDVVIVAIVGDDRRRGHVHVRTR